jgi:hypothetical protein
MGGMEKTTVYLTSAQKAALARAAAAEGQSEARLIRAGIDVVTARHILAETTAVIAPAVMIREEPATAGGRPRWLPRDEFIRAVLRHPADPGLRDELRELAPDTTDEAPLP